MKDSPTEPSVPAAPASVAAEDYLAGIFATSHDAIFVKDWEGRLLDWNPSAQRLFGYARDEILGRHSRTLIHPDLRGDSDRMLAQLARERRVDDAQTRGLRKDGTTFDAEVSLSVLPTRDHTLVLGVVRDVTERQQVRALVAALRDSERRFHNIAHATSDAIFDWDLRSDSVWWGDRAPLGHAPQTLATYDAYIAHVHPDDRQRITDDLQRTLARAGETHVDRFEYRLRRPDGRYGYVHGRAFVVRDAGGAAVRLLGGITDRSEHVETRAKLAAHAERLARSNAELERFAYVISHDLQEPLRSIASFAQLLGKRHATGPAKEYVDFIGAGVERMRDLIDGLLAYSRLSHPGATQDVALDEVLAAVRASLAAAIAEAQAAIEVGPLPTVDANGPQMHQLFQNLLSNAIKFRGHDPPRVRVSARREGRDWRFVVEDNGIGIDPAHAERVFLLFQRLHTRDVYPGSGIGLALCRRIVEAHGGRIWIEPAQHGTRFVFTLPARDAD